MENGPEHLYDTLDVPLSPAVFVHDVIEVTQIDGLHSIFCRRFFRAVFGAPEANTCLNAIVCRS